VPGCYNFVLKMDYEKNDPPTVFVGEQHKGGSDNAHFSVPTSVETTPPGGST